LSTGYFPKGIIFLSLSGERDCILKELINNKMKYSIILAVDDKNGI